MYRGFLNFIFPEPLHCKLCQQPMRSHGVAGICGRCIERLPLINTSACRVCGKPLYIQSTCSECDNEVLYFYERAIAVGLYEGAIRHYIHRLKYYKDISLAEPLGSLMAIRLKEGKDFYQSEVVIPVPISPKKKEKRGFNQSYLLARVISRILKKPLLSDCLKRVKDTRAQSSLSRQDRLKNLRGAFQVTIPGQLRGKEVLLVDDVYTTGSTVNECARVLMGSGALKVNVIVLATVALDSNLKR